MTVILNNLVQLVIIITLYDSQQIQSVKEFSLARYPDMNVYPNNSIININLIGEGHEGYQMTESGALECHTDDTTCCRARDNPNPNGPGRGEWYYPDGTIVPPPGGNTGLYRTRGYMAIRLNRISWWETSFQTGVYRCEIPAVGGGYINRYITLTYEGFCSDLVEVSNSRITYTPPHYNNAPAGQRHTGTIATYSCLQGYTLVGRLSLRVCGPNGTWNGTEPFCQTILVQLRFGKLSCVHFSSVNSLQRLEDITAVMITNLNNNCSCQLSSSNFLNSRLQCSEESPQTVTFRTQLSGTTIEVVSYIEQWTQSGDFLLNGVRLTFNTTCLLQITSFDSEECSVPTDPVTTDTATTYLTVNNEISGLVMGIILFVFAVLISPVIVISLVMYIYFRKKKQASNDTRIGAEPQSTVARGSDTKSLVTENKNEDVEYEEIAEFFEERNNLYLPKPYPPKGEYKLTQCDAYNLVSFS